MNFLKKMENLLEQVDSQAAKTIQSPKAVLPTMLSTGALGSKREAGMFDASTQELIDEDFDLDLSLTELQPEKQKPLPRAVSTPAVRQPPRVRAEAAQRPPPPARSKLVEQRQVEEEFFADVGDESPSKATAPVVVPSTSAWDDWETDVTRSSATFEGEKTAGDESVNERETLEREQENESVAEPLGSVTEETTETVSAEEDRKRMLDDSLDALSPSPFVPEPEPEKTQAAVEEEATSMETFSESSPPAVTEVPRVPVAREETQRSATRDDSEALRRLQGQLSDTRAELEDTKAELREVSEEKASALVEQRLLKSRFATLQQKAKELSERYGKLQQALKSSQVQMKRVQEERSLLSSKVEALEGQREKLDAELRNRDTQQLLLQKALDEKDHSLQAAEAEAKELSVQLEHYGSVQRELESGKTRDLEEEASKREQLEQELEQRRLEQAQEREEASTRRQALEEEVAQLSGTLQSSMEELQRLKEQRVRDEAEIKRYIKDTSSLRQELTGYKKRAAQVLQEKDTQILNLSQPSIDPEAPLANEGGVSSQASGRSDREMEEIIDERNSLAEQLQISEQRLNALSESLMESERQAAEEQELLQVAVDEAQAQLEQERLRMRQVQLDKLSISKELASAREKLDQQLMASKQELEAKDAAFEKLKRKMALQANSSSTESELEERLQQMTETIIRKQTTIDTLTSENAALQMHLESKLQSADGPVGSKFSYQRGTDVAFDRSTADDLEDEEMGRERDTDRVTPLMTLVPNLATSNSFYAQQVKRAAAFIDRLTAQVNQLLRQHPSARLSLGLYLLALHVYLFFSFFIAGEAIATEASE